MRGALAALLVALGCLCCGPAAGGRGSREPPGPGRRLDPIYDVAVSYPGVVIIIGGLSYQGLDFDLEITFDDETLRDADPAYRAEARVVSVMAGGVAQEYEVQGPLVIQGSLAGDDFSTGLFGPIRIATSTLLLDLSGTLEDSARRVTGAASLFGTTAPGSFHAVKRRRYLVAGTDRQVIGKVSVVSVRYDTLFTVADDLELISSDPVARVEDGRPFIVNRFSFDNLQGLDPRASFATAFQYSVGNGANPHDVVVLPPEEIPGAPEGSIGEAFVTRYEPPYNDVAVLDLKDGMLLDRIDLTPFARNPDHLPRADQALLHDGLLYVTMQDANRNFTLFMNGRVLVIDPVARRVIDIIELEGQNPFEALTFSRETSLIYVGLAGIFVPQSLTGGIETIDPATRRANLLVDDDALGGNVGAVTLASASRGYCVVTDASFRNYVKAFDPVSGEVLGTIFESPSQIASLEADGDGYLLVGLNDFFSPGILVFDVGTGKVVASLPARLPPFSLAILTRSLR